MTDNPFFLPTTTTTTTLSSLVIPHILGLAFSFFPSHSIYPLCHVHLSIPPFSFLKVSLILPYTSSFVVFLDKDGLQHFIHLLHPIQCISPNPFSFSAFPPPLPFHSSQFIHTFSRERRFRHDASFPVIYPSRLHVVLSDPLLPPPALDPLG